MVFKSFACFLSSDTSKFEHGSGHERDGLTNIEWPIKCQRHAEPGCSRRKDTIGLWEELDFRHLRF
jgi:hypothetical protein